MVVNDPDDVISKEGRKSVLIILIIHQIKGQTSEDSGVHVEPGRRKVTCHLRLFWRNSVFVPLARQNNHDWAQQQMEKLGQRFTSLTFTDCTIMFYDVIERIMRCLDTQRFTFLLKYRLKLKHKCDLNCCVFVSFYRPPKTNGPELY